MTSPAPATDRIVVWVARVSWLALVVVGGGAVGEALAPHRRAVEVVGTIAAWAGWAVVALALAVPSTVSLTVLRTITPLALGVSVATAARADTWWSAGALVAFAALATMATMSGEFGIAAVQASAYGDEERYPLRPPVPAMAAVLITWPLLAAATVVAPWGWATGRWGWATASTAAAVLLGWWLGRRYHRLARRWLVLVPAGLVVHDHVVLAETVMFKRSSVARLGLAVQGTDAADCTGPAAGHAVEVGLAESVPIVFAPTQRNPRGRAIHATGLLVAPTRPGRALAAAAARGLPVG